MEILHSVTVLCSVWFQQVNALGLDSDSAVPFCGAAQFSGHFLYLQLCCFESAQWFRIQKKFSQFICRICGLSLLLFEFTFFFFKFLFVLLLFSSHSFFAPSVFILGLFLQIIPFQYLLFPYFSAYSVLWFFRLEGL